MPRLTWIAWCAWLAACSKEPATKPATIQPTAAAGSGSGSARMTVGSAGDPAWVHDSFEVLRGKINGVNAHVVVLKRGDFTEYRDVLATAEKMPGVTAVEPFVMVELSIDKAGGAPHDITLKGIDPVRGERVLNVGRHMKTGSLAAIASGAPPAIVLGDDLARRLDATIGDAVTVRQRDGAVDDLMTIAKPTVFRVAGTFHVDFDVYDEMLALCSLPAAQAMVGHGDRVLGVEMTVDDLTRSESIAKDLEAKLGGVPYEVQDWYRLNEDLFKALGHARP